MVCPATDVKSSNPTTPHAVLRLVLWHPELENKQGDRVLKHTRGDVCEPGHEAVPECEKQLVLVSAA